MEPPQIQYARTSDGVNIGYAVVGTGPPFVMAGQIWGSLHMAQAGIEVASYWSLTDIRNLECSAVVYDVRGSGSSDRRVSDYTLAARVRDLEAVVDAVGFEQFPLFGAVHSAATAIAFAAKHPDAVEQLLLCNPFVSGEEYYRVHAPLRALKITESMAAEEWDYYTLSLASGVLGYEDPQRAYDLAVAFRSAMLPEDITRFRGEAESTNIAGLLGAIHVPTIVLRDDSVRLSASLARDVAAGISGARFMTTADHKATIRDILGRPRHVTEMAQTAPHRSSSATAVILFADVVDSTAVAGRLGNAAFRERTRRLEEALRAVIREAGGTPVEGRTLGDGVLGVFTSAAQAIDAAVHCGDQGGRVGLDLHLGIHAGDVIHESGNVSGVAVSMASRISDLTGPNEILVSSTVRDLARASTDVVFEDRGEHELKGVGEAVRVYAVRAREAG